VNDKTPAWKLSIAMRCCCDYQNSGMHQAGIQTGSITYYCEYQNSGMQTQHCHETLL
jgi:hypothetical protein